MPIGALRRCIHPGCRTLVTRGRCMEHAPIAAAKEAERQRKVDARRPPEVKGRYSSPEWRRARREFLDVHPLCPCGARAEAVDHVRPWRREPDPEAAFWDRRNWAPTCWRCHSRKTAKHDGGFGNKRATGRASG